MKKSLKNLRSLRRIKIVVQYVGTNYAGWQIQPNQKTIQGEIENAIFLALHEKCEVVGSGRTDAGVHALAQVAHFDTTSKIKAEKICYVLNEYLPRDISILESEEVSDKFNARFSAKKKTYQYNFYVSKIPLPCFAENYAHVPFDFDILKAQSVLDEFIGEHNFAAFCSSGSKVDLKDAVRTIYSLKIWQTDKQTYRMEVSGNGFLYNMVRIIAGTLIEVGCGKINPKKIKSIIKSKNRKHAGKTAPACGLTLKEVDYTARIRKKKAA